jgi:hypothetical protein
VRNYFLFGGIVTVLGLVLLILWHFHKPKYTPDELSLNPNEVAKVIVDTRQKRIAEVRRIKGIPTVVNEHTGIRKAEITVTKEGKVNVKSPIIGFTFEPGLVVGVANSFRVGLDAQFAYWNQFGIFSGITVAPEFGKYQVGAHLAVGMNLPFSLTPNTSVFVGYDTRARLIAGLRTAF